MNQKRQRFLLHVALFAIGMCVGIVLAQVLLAIAEAVWHTYQSLMNH